MSYVWSVDGVRAACRRWAVTDGAESWSARCRRSDGELAAMQRMNVSLVAERLSRRTRAVDRKRDAKK